MYYDILMLEFYIMHMLSEGKIQAGDSVIK